MTQVVVDADDPAFGRPTKPIGPFFSEGRARRLASARGWSVAEDSGRGWRRVVAAGVTSGVPLPAMASALAYYDGYRSGRLPANLLQAQRDYFGAHTYERVDKPRGQFFHTNWTGRGGTTASSTYNV